MKFLRRLNAEWALRFSLGGLYLYSSINILQYPSRWMWAVQDLPDVIQRFIASIFGSGAAGIERFLHIQGLVELVLAAIFLLPFMPHLMVRWAGLISTIEMASIVLLVGVSVATFRDIGLIGPGLALFLMLRY